MWKEHLLKFLNNALIPYAIPSAIVFLAVCLLVVIAEGDGFSQNKTPGDTVPEGEKIHITADRLVASQNNQMIVFSGNVKAIRDKMTITSDNLNVFYADPKNKSGKGLGKDSIERIVAAGNVTITMEGKTATCDQAVYQTSTRVMTLTGKNTRIQSGDNYITGNTVTIYQDTGQITVDGNDTKRVDAVFQPGDKSMTTDFK